MNTARRNRRRPRRWSDVDPTRRGLVMAWLTFTVTFAFARLVTGVIKLGDENTGDLTANGVHLHHYLWGMLLLVGAAFFGLVERTTRARTWMGAAFGVGLALVVDEAALLITLKDVYWHSQSWSSVGVAIVLVSIAGTALVLTRSGPQGDDAKDDAKGDGQGTR